MLVCAEENNIHGLVDEQDSLGLQAFSPCPSPVSASAQSSPLTSQRSLTPAPSTGEVNRKSDDSDADDDATITRITKMRILMLQGGAQ